MRETPHEKEHVRIDLRKAVGTSTLRYYSVNQRTKMLLWDVARSSIILVGMAQGVLPN